MTPFRTAPTIFETTLLGISVGSFLAVGFRVSVNVHPSTSTARESTRACDRDGGTRSQENLKADRFFFRLPRSGRWRRKRRRLSPGDDAVYSSVLIRVSFFVCPNFVRRLEAYASVGVYPLFRYLLLSKIADVERKLLS